jgi:hypothetical protein
MDGEAGLGPRTHATPRLANKPAGRRRCARSCPAWWRRWRSRRPRSPACARMTWYACARMGQRAGRHTNRPGRSQVLCDELPGVVASLAFKKSMRWAPGASSTAFSRPVSFKNPQNPKTLKPGFHAPGGWSRTHARTGVCRPRTGRMRIKRPVRHTRARAHEPVCPCAAASNVQLLVAARPGHACSGTRHVRPPARRARSRLCAACLARLPRPPRPRRCGGFRVQTLPEPEP